MQFPFNVSLKEKNQRMPDIFLVFKGNSCFDITTIYIIHKRTLYEIVMNYSNRNITSLSHKSSL